MLHPLHARCATCHKNVYISPGAQDLESMVAQGFVKHGLKMLFHCVVDGPLQVSRCLVLQSFNQPRSFIPSFVMYFGPLESVTQRPRDPTGWCDIISPMPLAEV